MSYIEFFAAPVRDDNRNGYIMHSRAMGAIFRDHGVLELTECWASNVPDGELTSFPQAVKLEEGESVVIGWMKWPSKDARDTGFGAAMDDPRMQELMGDMPFDGKRMIFGGFEPIVEM